ncbi:transmembrane protein adipocyte-associated 1 [Anaeramoeba ignava]|uniref:Transmembrane protein adipocyte-associated 1 n=1 Tax=Anaeramoeba ignava TaxID=1746090 RepID=A0A9Q0RBY0_ANAIG|nr:transmembrane protein adipocyte-associated 1 [Anaeramoeba ignava]
MEKVFHYFYIVNLCAIVPPVIYLFVLLIKLPLAIRRFKQAGLKILIWFYVMTWIIVLLLILQALFDRILVVELVTNSMIYFSQFMVLTYMMFGILKPKKALFSTLITSAIFTSVITITQLSFMELNEGFFFNSKNQDTVQHVFWSTFNGSFAIIYAILIFLPHFKKFEKWLPAKDLFYAFLFLLFVKNALFSFGHFSILDSSSVGYCYIDISVIIFNTFYIPFWYFTFLHGFMMSDAIPVYYHKLLISEFGNEELF